MTPYGHGQHEALSQLGLYKLANDVPPVAPPPGQFWSGAGKEISSALFGDPGKAVNELKNGTAWNKGSYVRSSILGASDPNAKGFGKYVGRAMHGLNYLPAGFSAYAAMKAPSDQKGKAWGNAIGTLLGTAVGLPLGIAGSTAGSLAGGHIGSMVGGIFDRRTRRPTYAAPASGFNSAFGPSSQLSDAFGVGQQGVRL